MSRTSLNKTGKLYLPGSERTNNNAPTDTGITAIYPLNTQKMIAPDKTAQFCNIVNMSIRNRFFCCNITIYNCAYQVLRMHSIEGGKIRVFFLDYENKVWNIEVNHFKAFTIFRGL